MIGSAGEGGSAEGGSAGEGVGVEPQAGQGGSSAAAGEAGAGGLPSEPGGPYHLELPAGCTRPDPYTRLSAASEDIPPAGLALWLRADVGLALDDQKRVCVWQDQSSRHQDVRQDTAGARPRTGATLGGKPAIDIDPGLTLSRDGVLGIGATSGRTIVAVYALDSAAKRFSIMQGDPSTNYAYVGLDDNTFNTVGNRYGCYETSQSYDSDAVTDTLAHVRTQLIGTLQPGLPVADHMTCRKDAKALELTYLCCDSSRLIGDFSTASKTFVPTEGDAKIAEVLFYDHGLSDADLQKVESSLRARYSLP